MITADLGIWRTMAMEKRRLILFFGISTLSGIVAGAVILLAINASFLRVPDAPQSAPPKAGQRNGCADPRGSRSVTISL